MWRHNPQTHALKALVDDGAIGELRLVRAAFSFNMTDADVNVRMRPDLEGGALMDLGCYCVSASRLLCGEPRGRDRATRPRSQWRGRACCGDALVRRATSSPSSTARSICRTSASSTLFGSEGSIQVSDPWHCRRPGLTVYARGRCRADRDGAGQLVPVGAREPRQGDPRRRHAAARPCRRRRAGDERSRRSTRSGGVDESTRLDASSEEGARDGRVHGQAAGGRSRHAG